MKRELKASYSWQELLDIVDDLRGEEGCPWDRALTMEGLKEYLVKETQEVCAAVDADDMDNLCEELGDVLFEVVLYTRMASERGAFAMNDVVSGAAAKMVRRHPHVFGDVHYDSPEEQHAAWQQIKEEERRAAETTGKKAGNPSGIS